MVFYGSLVGINLSWVSALRHGKPGISFRHLSEKKKPEMEACQVGQDPGRVFVIATPYLGSGNFGVQCLFFVDPPKCETPGEKGTFIHTTCSN